jgi:RNA recognition motif-containing protein
MKKNQACQRRKSHVEDGCRNAALQVACIEFKHRAAAKDAALRFDGVKLAQSPMVVRMSSSNERKVYVWNLPWSITEEMLKGTYEQIGKVTAAELVSWSDASEEDSD